MKGRVSTKKKKTTSRSASPSKKDAKEQPSSPEKPEPIALEPAAVEPVESPSPTTEAPPPEAPATADATKPADTGAKDSTRAGGKRKATSETAEERKKKEPERFDELMKAIKEGDEAAVKRMVESKLYPINKPDFEGFTPLMKCGMYDRAKAAQSLLFAKANIEATEDRADCIDARATARPPRVWSS